MQHFSTKFFYKISSIILYNLMLFVLSHSLFIYLKDL